MLVVEVGHLPGDDVGGGGVLLQRRRLLRVATVRRGRGAGPRHRGLPGDASPLRRRPERARTRGRHQRLVRKARARPALRLRVGRVGRALRVEELGRREGQLLLLLLLLLEILVGRRVVRVVARELRCLLQHLLVLLRRRVAGLQLHRRRHA